MDIFDKNRYETCYLSDQNPEFNLVLAFILTGLEDQNIVISELSDEKILVYKIKHYIEATAAPRKGWKGSNQLFMVIAEIIQERALEQAQRSNND